MKDDIIAAARECLETPFRHQGRIKGLALDCAGLAVHVMQTLNLPYRDLHGYSRIPHDGKLKSALDLQPSFERVDKPEPGDVLLLKFGREPTHVGIFTGTTLIHAYEPAGKVCEHGLDDYWHERVVAVYRIVRR